MTRTYFALTALLMSCASGAPQQAGSAVARSTPRSTGSAAQDSALEALVAEHWRLHDWRSTTFVKGMPAGEPIVRPTVAITKRASLPRPTLVRAYVWNDPSCATRSAFGLPFEADGTLCKGVVGASAVLDERERNVVVDLALAADAELVEIAAKRKPPRPIVSCDFSPHHAFVFFDDHGVPIARVEPCFECGQMLWEPSSEPKLLGTWEPPVMTSDERRTLGKILDQHGLGAWAFDPDGEQTKRVRAYDEAIYGSAPLTPLGRARKAERLALPPPVERDVSPRQATAGDRARLCAWFQDQLETNGLRMKTSGYECTTGVRYVLTLEAGDCETSVARCNAPTRRIEDCLRAFAQGPEAICAQGFPSVCSGLRECVPGLTEFTAARRP